MRIAYPDQEQNKELAEILIERMGGVFTDAHCLAVIDNKDNIVGIVAFFNYRWPSIEVGFFCDDFRWALNRDGIIEVLNYPFVQLRCHRITALVEKKNTVARKMVQRLGFVEEGKLRKAGQNGDLFIYGLLPQDLKLCRNLSRPSVSLNGLRADNDSLKRTARATGMTVIGH